MSCRCWRLGKSQFAHALYGEKQFRRRALCRPTRPYPVHAWTGAAVALGDRALKNFATKERECSTERAAEKQTL